MASLYDRLARRGGVHRSGLVRTDQVRRQRIPCDEDLVHQQRCGAVRGGRRRRRRASSKASVPTVGSAEQFLQPGPGWGGSCFPKDSRALVSIAADHDFDFSLMRGVIDINEQQYDRMVAKIQRAVGRDLDGRLDDVVIGALGLTFKAGTDDLTGISESANPRTSYRASGPRPGLRPDDRREAQPDPGRSAGRAHALCDGDRRRHRRRCRRRLDRMARVRLDRPLQDRRRDAAARHWSTVATCSTPSRFAGRPQLRRRRSLMSADRTLVAGGAGFLGSHLCDQLLLDGDEVLCVDDCSTGSLDNIAHLPRSRPVRVSPTTTWSSPVSNARRNDVARQRDRRDAHLASPGIAHPSTFADRSTPSTSAASAPGDLLDLSVEHRARFFLASTSEVYGDPLVHPQPESYWGNVNPIGERSVYDEAQAVRRGAHDGLSPSSRTRRSDRADLQHLRPAYAGRRRSGRDELRQPGAPRRSDHDLRRRKPDTQLLLRRRRSSAAC